jgi:hypothetical protein
MNSEIGHNFFSLSPADFEQVALDVFHYQWKHNALYRNYGELLGVQPREVRSLQRVPFLPISFFKNHRVASGDFNEEVIFESSGTTGSSVSRHFIKDLNIYRQSFRQAFTLFYGDPRSYCILGLLPSYLERGHSSLVYMVDHLIRESGHPLSGFYLYDHEKLSRTLVQLEASGQRTLLIGVTFALLDFAAKFPLPLQHTIVMETGGMKGRREELTRGKVHDILQKAFQCEKIHSEYGMTELLSQAYSTHNGLFQCPPWMRILIRDEDDPFTLHSRENARGGINVIDLANIHSCSFIATEDVGRLYSDGHFEVLGRMDSSELRGCSLMAV